MEYQYDLASGFDVWWVTGVDDRGAFEVVVPRDSPCRFSVETMEGQRAVHVCPPREVSVVIPLR